MSAPVLGVTCGDPAGIGLEVTLRALAESGLAARARVVLYAARAHLLGERRWLAGDAAELADPDRWEPLAAGSRPPEQPGLSLVAQGGPAEPPTPGRWDAAWGAVALEALEQSARDAVAGRTQGVVTAPISKQVLPAESGFPGQTELYAARSGTKDFAMMLAGPSLRVVPVTIHVALRDVPRLLTRERVLGQLRVTARALREDFGIADPLIAVCGLNPHAGEGGRFGDEEQRVLVPALEEARAEGIRATGPSAADSLFWFAARGGADAVLCMYHDQGLIPIKLLHFEEAVNLTLGLPFVRTSPDHGSAYDIAGQGRANPSSIRAALTLAIDLVQRRATVDREP